jgi:hypothetical protein
MGLRGEIKVACSSGLTQSGAGNARRSTLPLGVKGSVSSSTNAAGTMYAGSSSAKKLRMSLPDSAPCRVSSRTT